MKVKCFLLWLFPFTGIFAQSQTTDIQSTALGGIKAIGVDSSSGVLQVVPHVLNFNKTQLAIHFLAPIKGTGLYDGAVVFTFPLKKGFGLKHFITNKHTNFWNQFDMGATLFKAQTQYSLGVQYHLQHIWIEEIDQNLYHQLDLGGQFMLIPQQLYFASFIQNVLAFSNDSGLSSLAIALKWQVTKSNVILWEIEKTNYYHWRLKMGWFHQLHARVCIMAGMSYGHHLLNTSIGLQVNYKKMKIGGMANFSNTKFRRQGTWLNYHF